MKNLIPLRRFDAFSDAIFAIAMTIMVLELKLPDLGSHVTTATIASALANLIPISIAYLASFSMLAQLWVSHSRLTTNDEVVSPRSAQLNLLLLFFVCLVPFPTALLGQFGPRAAVLVPYGFVILGASAALGLLRFSILADNGATRSRIQLQQRRIGICAGVSVLGLVCAFISDANLILGFIALGLIGSASLSYRFVR